MEKGGLVLSADIPLATISASSTPVPVIGGKTGSLMELATADGIISYSFSPGAQPHQEEPVSKDEEPDIGGDKDGPTDNNSPQAPDDSGGGCNAAQSIEIFAGLIFPVILRKRKERKRE